MVFSSLYFTFFFLPLVCILYYISKENYRNYILLIASLFFYAYGEPKFIIILLGSIGVNYGFAVWIDVAKEKLFLKKILLTVDIIFNIGILIVFKYFGFLIYKLNFILKADISIRNIALPIGISFFTFQALSYVIDVYKGTVAVQKNFLYLALYISFFPQLIAGPIVRYCSVAEQITNRFCNLEKFSDGVRRFLLGFCKKVILANNLSVVVGEVFSSNPVLANPLALWIGSICYSLQLFYDFSGYSDMAIGLGKLFGFEFEENFNYPYVSKSITEFWRRWHISLGRWFRDYVYIPLGGVKVSVSRHLLNMFIVWTLTGLWHGAGDTFVAWGLGYFFLLAIEKYIVKPEERKSKLLRIIWQIATLVCVNFGWILFNSADIKSGIKYCLAMVGFYGQRMMVDSAVIRHCREYGFFIICGILFATPVVRMIRLKIENLKISGFVEILIPLGYGVLFMWATSFIILGSHNPFIYFNF